jgi:myo-inositol-1-phosphate synthase
MPEIRIALVGIGNCASALVQGLHYYRDSGHAIPGLISPIFAGYRPSDISVVAAFDIDGRKAGRPLHEAVFAPPNCTRVFAPDLPAGSCAVVQGYRIDSVAPHMLHRSEATGYRPLENLDSGEVSARERIVDQLRASRAEVLVNYLPVGSEKNTSFYADCAIEAGCAMVNAIPVFLQRTHGAKFAAAGLPLLGDDIKSQVGATILHRALAKLFEERGHPVRRSYQLNVGGNTDFLTMLDRDRLDSKKESKTRAVSSMLPQLAPENLHVGPSDYVPWLGDNKVCFLRIEAEQFGGIPMELEVRLSVEDSPNSAGVIMDAVRAAKVALDRGMGGPVIEASAWLFKSPPQQFDDETAREMFRCFERGN